MHLYYEIHGNGHPLILLHGFLGSSDNWRAMRNRFSDRYRVLSVDLRNHGRSPHSDTMNYPLMAQDLRELMLEQSLSNVFLLGHSMGGKIAMQLAAESADFVGKLIVVDIAPRGYPPTQRPLLAALQNLEIRSLKSFAEAEAALAPAIPDLALRRFLIKNLVREADGNFHWRIGLESIARNYDELTKPIRLANVFDKPASFIRAGHSSLIAAEDFATIRKHFPRAEFRTIDNAGHWVHIDAPEIFYRTVTEFLDS